MHNLSIQNHLSRHDVVIGLIMSSSIINLLGLCPPLILLQLCDRIIPDRAIETLMVMLLVLAAIILLETSIKIARTFVCAWGDAKLSFNLSNQAFSYLVHANQLDIDKKGIGKYIESISALDSLKQLISGQTIITILDIPFIFLSVAIIAYINLQIAALVLVLQFTLMLYIYAQSITFSKRLAMQAKQKETKANFLVEAISNIHTIKSLGIEALHTRKFSNLTSNTAFEDYKVYLQNNSIVRAADLIIQINIIAVVTLGAMLYIRNELSIGALAGCALLSIKALQPLSQIMLLWKKSLALRMAKRHFAEIAQLTQAEIQVFPPMPQHLHGKISLRKLGFQYSEHDPWILHDVNLDILAGEFIALHNGQGKTTLLSILAGLLPPTTGKVIIDDKYAITQYDSISYRKQIAFIAANGKLFDGTILDNLTGFNNTVSPDTVYRVLNELGIANALAMLPNGLQTYIGNAVEENVSRGFKQQLLIARAFIANPKIIILDEATTSLDLRAIKYLVSYLQKLKGKVTVIMATNCQPLLALADQQFNLSDSKLVIHQHIHEGSLHENC